MKTTEQVFYLIKSLSKAEKRSFKLFINNYSKGDKNNYALLFDAIDKMEVYDHGLLVKKLADKLNIRTISTLKVQLNELILKSLRMQAANNSDRLKLWQNIDFIDILFEKGLYRQARKLLDKATTAAWKSQNYLALDRLSVLEFNIALKESNKEDLDHYINFTYPKVSEVRKKNEIGAAFEYITIQMRLFLLESTSLGGKQSKERLNTIVSHTLLQSEPNELPLNCQMDYHIIWGHYHYAFDHPNEVYYHRKRALDIAEELGMTYRIWLTHARFLLIGLSTFRLFKELEKEKRHILNYIDNIPKHIQEASFADEVENTLNNIQINSDLDQGNFSAILDYLERLESKYSDETILIDNNLRMAFYFNFAYAYFANGQYKKALRWLNRILNTQEMRALREDLHTYLRIMQICIHYALGNYELIRSLVKSTTRYLKKQNRDIDLLINFLRFANLHFIQPYSSEKSNFFDAIVEQLEENALNQEGKIAMEYIDLISWLKAYYTNDSMENVYKLRHEF